MRVEADQKVGAVQLSARLRGVSPPVIRRLLITEQSSLAELHASLQVSFGWSDQHLYSFQIRGWQFGDPARAIELALAAFGFDVGEPFLYLYNLLVPWEIECRIEARGLIRDAQPVTCWLGTLVLMPVPGWVSSSEKFPVRSSAVGTGL